MVAEKVDQNNAQKAEVPSAENKKEPITDETPKNDSLKKTQTPAKKEAQEQKPKETISTTDDQSKPSEDATLILSAEEEAEIAAQTNEDAVKAEPPKTATSPAKQKTQRNVWVSSISRGTKAADLKKIFSESYKVESAKIVTNGKSYFGYICLETPEMAQKSVKALNGSNLGSRKITVSLTRPDLRAARSSAADTKRGKEPRKEARVSSALKKSEKTNSADGDKGEEKKEGGTTETAADPKQSTGEKKKEVSVEEKLRISQRREQKANRQIQDLKTDLNRVTTELQNNRRRLSEATKRLEAERTRKTSMRRDIENMENQLKSERRKFCQELEQMDKKRKMDESRYQDDRNVLNKELDECRKLREYLQRKIDDLGIARHGRSPPRRSGPDGRGMPNRGPDKMGRSRMHSSDGRGRSPPPPPKINSRRSRDRSPTSYKGGKKPRLDESLDRHSAFGNSHYSGQGSSFSSGTKPLLGHYPPSGSSGGQPRATIYGTAYPEPQRYGSGYPGGYSLGNPASLLSRPIGYPDVRGSVNQRKY